MNENLLEIRGVSYNYGGVSVLKGLNLTIKSGEVIGLLGVNGAGKTTLIKMLTGGLEPSAGTLYFKGAPLSNALVKKKLRSLLGYLPETPPLYLDLTIQEYISFICGLKGLRKNQARAEIIRVSEELSLKEKLSALISSLSKGYRQRVGLAAALLGKPPLLILDEPFVGLDPQQILLMRKVIERARQYSTLLFSSHILQEVEQLATKTLVLSAGKALFWGLPKEASIEGVFILKIAFLESPSMLDISGMESFFQQVAFEKGFSLQSFTWDIKKGARVVLRKAANDATIDISIRRKFMYYLNSSLIQHGYKVAEFKEENSSLESFFLQLVGA